MITLDFSTIFGMSLGFELADKEVREEVGLYWGLAVDFFIFRISLNKWK